MYLSTNMSQIKAGRTMVKKLVQQWYFAFGLLPATRDAAISTNATL